MVLQYVNLGEFLYYMTVQNLTYDCINIYLSSVTDIEVPPKIYIQHDWQLSKITSQYFKDP